MGAGQITGAYFGSKLVIKNGTGFVRTFFLIIVAATIIKLFYSSWMA